MLRRVLKRYRYAQEKACPPEETIERVKKRWREGGLPKLKIVSLSPYDRLELPVYSCLPAKEIPLFPGTFGKGGTKEEALASALMELVERVSGNTFLANPKNFSLATLEEVGFSPEEILLPFDPVYREEEILRRLKAYPLLWARGVNLTLRRESPIPLVWFNYLYGTTGWAAGNTLEEALHQALCEVIERHAISTIIEEKREVPTIRLESITHEVARDILGRFQKAGINLLIKDFSLSLAIPTVATIAFDPKPPHPKLKWYATAGTHPSRELALVRALIELAQHRAQLVYRETVLKKPGGTTFCFPPLEKEEAISFLKQGPTVSFEDLPSSEGSDFAAEIDFMVEELRKEGFSVYWVETTHPKLRIPAVMVHVPGARLNRPSTKIHPLVLLSRQMMELKRFTEAAGLLEEAFSSQPGLSEVPQILCQAARCYKLAGNKEKASFYFEKAAQTAPYLLFSPKFRQEWDEVKG